MPRTCPVSLKRRDIYGASMEHHRDILRVTHGNGMSCDTL
jgi:hypothetical protein